jgi:uncharacterized protein (TIRG00374 family)
MSRSSDLPFRLARLRFLLWLALPLGFAWGMRGVTVRQVIDSLRQLTAGELFVLAAVNLLVVLAFSGRWWALLRARGQRLPYLALSGYRLAAFAVSYFTPGTHFGGEPLQVHLLQRRHDVPSHVATASVVLDKAIELIANFAFLAIGLAIVVRLGLQPAGSGMLLRISSLALAILPIAYLLAAWRGHRPASWALARLRWASAQAAWKRNVSRWAEATESEVSAAARHSPAGLAAGALFTILSWVLLIGEWALAMRFLEIALTPAQVIAVVTAARLALFVPLPGAAGALEASLVLALTSLGASSSQALSLAVVIRLRDVAFGAFGLWLGGWLSSPPSVEAPAPGEVHDARLGP